MITGELQHNLVIVDIYIKCSSCAKRNNNSIKVKYCSRCHRFLRLIAEMSSRMYWSKVDACAHPQRLRFPGCRKRRSIARDDGLAILRACPRSLSLLGRYR